MNSISTEEGVAVGAALGGAAFAKAEAIIPALKKRHTGNLIMHNSLYRDGAFGKGFWQKSGRVLALKQAMTHHLKVFIIK